MTRTRLVVLGCGATFAVGLTLAGMEDPSVILHSFTVDGFDPRLALLLIGALVVQVAITRIWGTKTNAQPQAKAPVDRRLVFGSILFGIGWGLGGMCPGPGVTAALSGAPHAALFVIGLVAGIVFHDMVERRHRRRAIHGHAVLEKTRHS